MEAKSNADLRLAAELSRPFLLPGQVGQPLSCRALPDGGMVVIAADGRKMWFTCREVNVARKKLRQPPVNPGGNNDGLTDYDPSKTDTYHPRARFREGESEMIVLPEDLKHLEKKINERPFRFIKPGTPGTG
jgi:hypothetical protein